jgi:hypothetical protein
VSAEATDRDKMEDPIAELARAIERECLRGMGYYRWEEVDKLPPEKAKQVREKVATDTSLRLAAIEAKERYLDSINGISQST